MSEYTVYEDADCQATTAETPTMLDSLAEEARQTWIRTPHNECWPTVVEAVLTKMLEPSEGMLDATTSERKFIGHPEASESSRRRQMAGFQAAAKGHWQTMIQHILNETKD